MLCPSTPSCTELTYEASDTLIELDLPIQNKAPVKHAFSQPRRSRQLKQESAIDHHEQYPTNGIPPPGPVSAASKARGFVKSEYSSADDLMGGDDANSIDEVPSPTTLANYRSDGVAQVSAGVGFPPNSGIDTQYHADISSASAPSSRSGSQASHSQSLLSSLPMQRNMSGQSPFHAETCMKYNGSRFPKEMPTMSASSHAVYPPGMAQQMAHHQPFEQIAQTPRVNPVRLFPQYNDQAQLEIRPKPTRDSFASAGLSNGQFPSTTIGISYPQPESVPATSATLQQYHPAMASNEGQADHEAYGVTNIHTGRNFLIQDNWYATHLDTSQPTDMSDQMYANNPNFGLALDPSHAHQSDHDTLVDQRHTFAAPEWPQNSYPPGQSCYRQA